MASSFRSVLACLQLHKLVLISLSICCTSCHLFPAEQRCATGHTVNISASAMQAPLRDSSEPIKAIHHTTPDSVPAAAAAAAAMHAASHHSADVQQPQLPSAAPALHSTAEPYTATSRPSAEPVTASQSRALDPCRFMPSLYFLFARPFCIPSLHAHCIVYTPEKQQYRHS